MNLDIITVGIDSEYIHNILEVQGGVEVKNEFVVELIGNTSLDRKVPLSVAIKTFAGLQSLFYEIGNINLEESELPLGKGPRSNELKQYCELYLTEAKHGSLYATMELPISRQDLARELMDLPEKLISDFKAIVESLSSSDSQSFLKNVKRPVIQKKILALYNSTFPNDTSEYAVNLNFKNEFKIKNITKIPKERINEFVSQDSIISNSFVREEIEIRADIITVLNDDGTPDLHNARLLSYESIGDVRPYRANVIKNQNTEILLKNELVCNVTIVENYYFIENDFLELQSFGESRGKAITAFNEDFAMLYECYYLEDDLNLTKDALELKQKLKLLIQGGQLIVDDENQ